MNAHDIAAARRLIAQFEGKAEGRHNSTRLPNRPVMIPQFEARVIDHEARVLENYYDRSLIVWSLNFDLCGAVQPDWKHCALGEYVFELPVPDGCVIAMLAPERIALKSWRTGEIVVIVTPAMVRFARMTLADGAFIWRRVD